MIEFTKKPNEYNPLVLAYIGDSLYDVYVRSRIISEHGGLNANKMHVMSIKFVKAHGQSEAVARIENELTEDEMAAYKRGRNTKSYTVPKNADVGEYRRATGFEALMGWLYVSGSVERMHELMKMSFDYIQDKEK